MIIANKYRVQHKLNNGEFGTIFKAVHIRTEEEVAIKIEPKDAPCKLLKNEAVLYQFMGGRVDGVPHFKWFGVWENFTYLVLPLLGPSLTTLLRMQKCFSPRLTLHFGREMLQVLRNIHEKGLIHRDVKPDNFLLGSGDRPAGAVMDQEGSEETRKIFLIDFGFCRRYVNSAGAHMAFRDDKDDILGTPAYVSVHVHFGQEPSRRDDLESMGYCLLLFALGSLPWLYCTDSVEMRQQKEEFLGSTEMGGEDEDDITLVKIREFTGRCHSLAFDETPDYELLDRVLTA